MKSQYIKVVGLKFDPLEGLEIVSDSNFKNFKESAEPIDQKNDGKTFFIGIPCECTIK